MERWAGSRFSNSYFATRPPRNCTQKYLRMNQYLTQLVEQQIIWLTCKQLLFHGYRVLGEIPWDSKFGAMSSYVLESGLTWKIARGCQICLQTGVRDFFYPMKWLQINWMLYRKFSRWLWQKNIFTKKSPLLYIGGVQQNSYFCSCWYYGRCGWIDCTKLLGGLFPGGTEYEALKGWLLKIGYDSKQLRISVEFFCWLAIQ